MIAVSYEQLAELFPKGRSDLLAAVADQADEVLARFGINETLNRLSFFFAQVGHESAGFSKLEESFYYTKPETIFRWYAKRGRFRSVQECVPFVRNSDALRRRLYGDEPSYYGRGLIQLTLKENYEKIGEIVGLPLATNPSLAADPQHALLIACGYWQLHDINQAADHEDYDGASKRINPNDKNPRARRAYLVAARWIFGGASVGGGPAPSRAADVKGDMAMLAFGERGPQVEALQRTLESLNYAVGKTDGNYGRLTRAAVAAFQLDNDMQATGDVDSATWDKLSTAPPRPLDKDRTEVTAGEVREQGSRTVRNADYVGVTGIATAVLGALGLADNIVAPVQNTAAVATVAAAPTAGAAASTATDLAEKLKALSDAGAQFPQLFDQSGPALMAALQKWVDAGGNSPQASDLGQVLGSLVGGLVPGGITGSVLLTALGVGVKLFANRIIDARVADYRNGNNLGR